MFTKLTTSNTNTILQGTVLICYPGKGEPALVFDSTNEQNITAYLVATIDAETDRIEIIFQPTSTTRDTAPPSPLPEIHSLQQMAKEEKWWIYSIPSTGN